VRRNFPQTAPLLQIKKSVPLHAKRMHRPSEEARDAFPGPQSGQWGEAGGIFASCGKVVSRIGSGEHLFGRPSFFGIDLRRRNTIRKLQLDDSLSFNGAHSSRRLIALDFRQLSISIRKLHLAASCSLP